MKKLSFSFVLFGILLAGCSKEQIATNATIEFIEPTIGDTFNFADEVHAEGTVTSNGEMHGFTLTITNTTTGSLVYEASSQEHLSNYSFHEHWINNVTDTSNLQIDIKAILNHDGTSITKSVDVVCLPQ
jgi:hypothetical protein